jgi:hypothetical protein
MSGALIGRVRNFSDFADIGVWLLILCKYFCGEFIKKTMHMHWTSLFRGWRGAKNAIISRTKFGLFHKLKIVIRFFCSPPKCGICRVHVRSGNLTVSISRRAVDGTRINGVLGVCMPDSDADLQLF